MTDRKPILDDPRLTTALRWGSRLLTVAIVAYLLVRLSELGWRELLGALPTSPWFYVLFVVVYLTLPVSELFVYRQAWPLPSGTGLRALVRKRVFNEEMVGYSGEVFFVWWLAEKLGVARREAFRVVRDNNILSSVASTTVAALLLGVLAASGTLQFDRLFARVDGLYVAVGIAAVVVITVVAVRFRRYFFSLPRSASYRILSIHFARLILANALLVAQWAVGVPSVAVTVWLTYLCVLIVMNRLPFLPSKDLFFLGASVELSELMGFATTAIAGMLLTSSVLVRLANVSLFIVLPLVDRDGPDIGDAP